MAVGSRTHIVVVHLDAPTHIAHQFSHGLSRLFARRTAVGVDHGIPVEGRTCRNGIHMVMMRIGVVGWYLGCGRSRPFVIIHDLCGRCGCTSRGTSAWAEAVVGEALVPLAGHQGSNGLIILFAGTTCGTLHLGDLGIVEILDLVGVGLKERLEMLRHPCLVERTLIGIAKDCWRTVIIVAIGTALLLLYKAGKLKALPTIGAIAALCLVDMWQVDKRYLNDGMFVPKSEREAPQQMTATDEKILEDKSLDYRVLNFASNTFNENETSYYHKSIGGYHAAKLRRYQELIERYISPEMQKTMKAVAAAGGDMSAVKGDSIFPVLNMLNTKYFIMPLQGGETMPVENPYAMGNAWMVDKVMFVDNANQELDAVGKIDLRHEAVAMKIMGDQLQPLSKGGESQNGDSTAIVKLTKYEPNQLEYDVKSAKGGVVVFSEIYYPGWTATVDGQETPVGRVDYVLRAINVKAGNHKVVLTFKPQSIVITETIAYCALIILVVAVLAILSMRLGKKTTKSNDD